jgi:DNA-binding winged helix-turn-helix (wHTH) protein/Tol biopolymer transport system component
MSLSDSYLYEFGDFRLNTKEKFLEIGESKIPLTPKVFEVLIFLLENSGKLIIKEELLDKVWAESFVEESNLTFTISQLRKILGDDARHPKFIETIAKRGYRFIVEVNKTLPENPQTSELPEKTIESFLPEPSKTALFIKNFSRRPILFALFGTIGIITISLFLWGNVSQRNSNIKLVPLVKPEKLTNSGNARRAAISPDGNLVSYISQVNGLDSIWLRQIKTNSNLQILPPTDEVIRRMRFSADGQSVFFIKGKRGEPSSLFSLATIGGLPRKIIDGVEDVLALSPDGKKIALVKMFEPNAVWSLSTANVDGSEETSLITRPIAEPIWAVAWSNVKQSIAFATGETRSGQPSVSIFEYGLEGKAEKILSTKKWFQIKDLAWNPNDEALILSGREKLSDQNELWEFSPAKDEFSRFSTDTNYYNEFSLTTDGKTLIGVRSVPSFNLSLINVENPSIETKQLAEGYRGVDWSKNNRIAYASSIGGNEDIWTMNPDGSEQKQLTFDNSTEFLPRFSADGKTIAYVSSNSGTLHIWRMNADGSEPRQLTKGTGELSPNISHDGKWLIFHTTSDEMLWKMLLDGGEPIKIAEHALRAEISPDGKSVVFLHPSNKTSVESTIYVVSFENGEKLHEFKIDGKSLSAWRFVWAADGNGFFYASYDNNSVANVHFQLLSGDNPKKITNFIADQIFDFDLSPDSKQFAIIRGSWNQDVMILKTFD